MKQKLNLSNSIYQQKGSGYGLQQRNGMLINNRPDGVTGIAQATQMRKIMAKAEKVSTMAEAYSLGEKLSDMGESCGCK